MVLSAMAAAIVLPGESFAAGGAYAVDPADVTNAGACKIESWASWASNRDFNAVTSPGCGFDAFRPFEVSTAINRARSDGDWATGLSPKAKVNLVPTAIGSWGLSLSASTSFDLTAGQTSSVTIMAPATLRLSENMRININGGWLYDHVADRHYLAYGAGFDLRTSDNVWILTAEVFGQAGRADVSSVVQPRVQAGLRFRPGGDRFSVDLIYGRNITGENANWITLATILRFPAPDKK